MLRNCFCRALPLAFVALIASYALAFAADVSSSPSTDLTAASAATPTSLVPVMADDQHWTAYGFNITAPSSMWPMLELLHKYHFDWELYSAQQRPTPLVWAQLPVGAYGQYVPSQNLVKVSWVLQDESVELGTAFLAH